MFKQNPDIGNDIYKFRRGDTTCYFTAAAGATAGTTLALTANRLYGIPFFVPTTFKIGQFDIRVTTAATGKARMGIYADNNVIPGKLLLDAGEVDTGATGVKGIIVTKVLRGGKLYWLALVANAAPTIRALAVGSNLTNFFGLSSALDTAWRTYCYRTFTYAALPDPFGTPTLATGTMPAVFLRKDNLA